MQRDIKARRKKYPAQVAALLCMQGLVKYKCLHDVKLKDHFFLPSFFFLLLFICEYKAWVISPPCPHTLPYHPLRPLPLQPHPLNTQQKLFCPYF
jgi:hypothetical protein